MIDFEAPAERTRLWHNMMDAEQNYGILGEYAGSAGTTPVLGASPGPWRALTTVAAGTGALRIRVPWGLQNVTDPSSRTVLFDRPGRTGGDFGTAMANGFRFGALLYRKGRGTRPIATLPVAEGQVWRASAFRTWTWHTWEQPASHSRLKPVYDSLKATWRDR